MKFRTGSGVEENKRKNVPLRINDGQLIYFVIFPLASRSSMNFHSLKLPVKGKPLVLSSCTVVAEAQKNTFIGSQRKTCLVNLELP